MIARALSSLPLFRVRAGRALCEMVFVQGVIAGTWLLFDATRVQVDDAMQFFSLLYLLSSFLWCALRWRLRPETRTPWQQLVREAGMAGALLPEILLSMGLLWLFPIHEGPLDFLAIFHISCVAALGTSFIFFAVRMSMYIWRFWDRLRRAHLRWALTHAHLMVVVIGAGAISTFIIAFVIFADANNERSTRAFFAPIAVLAFMVIVTCIVLACVLPPSALFSYIFARKTTRRIEKLAAATSAIRAGDYAVRVSVEGEDEIARLQADFNVMATELERTLRELQEERDTVSLLLHARRELIANVSHELRTPVATVRSYLEATLSNWNEQPPPTLRQDLHIMEQQAIRLQSLIDDLFTLARAEVKRLELQCVPTNVELLVTRVVEMMAPIAWRRSRVEVLADTSAAVSPFLLALIDGNRLEQVLQNLLHNAIRHTPPGGIVIVSLEAEAETLLIQVKDTGEGIPAQETPCIWERFYRTESALRHPDSGTGLGLAIVKELTEAMGGTASVTSVLGQGTCFTLQFPLAPSNALVENPPSSVSRSRIHT